MPLTRLLGATVVTMDGRGTVIPDGEVCFADDILTYVGPRRDPRAAPGPHDLDVTGHLVIPGLVNAHTHSAMTLLRGTADGNDFTVWLRNVQSAEQQLTHDDVAAGLRLALVEMIRSGTTAFADMYFWDSALLHIVRDAGLRINAAPALFDTDVVGFPALSTLDGRGILDHTEALVAEFADDDHVRVSFGPHAPYTCSTAMLTEVAERAARLGVMIHTHLSETAGEVERSLAAHGRTPVGVADDTGLLGVPALVAHLVHPTDDDLAVLAARGAAVSHNPLSNLKLACGVQPLGALRAAGVLTGLGTDGAASNNSLDLLEEIRLAAVLHRVPRADVRPAVQPAVNDVLTMATRDGAAAIGFPRAGVLEPGRWADLVVVRTDAPHAVPMGSAESFLGFAARGSDIRHVFVGGRHLLDDGSVTTLDEDIVRSDAHQVAERLRTTTTPTKEK